MEIITERKIRMKYIYKAVAAIGSLIVIPALAFLSTIYYKFSSPTMALLTQILAGKGLESAQKVLAENGGTAPQFIEDSTSFYNIGDLLYMFKDSAGSNPAFDTLKPAAITLVIIAILIAVIAIVTAVLAFVAKDNRKVYYSSLAGIGASVMFKFAFESLTAPLVDGTISVSDIIQSSIGAFIAKAEVIELSTAFYAIPALFLCVMVWTFIYNYTLPDKEKAERKKFIDEVDNK